MSPSHGLCALYSPHETPVRGHQTERLFTAKPGAGKDGNASLEGAGASAAWIPGSATLGQDGQEARPRAREEDGCRKRRGGLSHGRDCNAAGNAPGKRLRRTGRRRTLRRRRRPPAPRPRPRPRRKLALDYAAPRIPAARPKPPCPGGRGGHSRIQPGVQRPPRPAPRSHATPSCPRPAATPRPGVHCEQPAPPTQAQPRPGPPERRRASRPLIGCGRGGGRALAESGGFKMAAARRRLPEEPAGKRDLGGGFRRTASAPGRGRWRAPEPPLGLHAAAAREEASDIYLRPPGLHLSAPLLLLNFHLPQTPRGPPVGDGADTEQPSLYLHSLPRAGARPPPRQLSRSRGPAPGTRRQSGGRVPGLAHARSGRCGLGGAPPYAFAGHRLARSRTRLLRQDQ